MIKCGGEGSKKLEKLGIVKWMKEPWVVRQKKLLVGYVVYLAYLTS
jgi:hypothetical protein